LREIHPREKRTPFSLPQYWRNNRNPVKLKKLATWNEWEAGEHKKLDQFYCQKMFGEAIDPMSLPKQAVILCPHWNYIVKRSGVCRSRCCCNGSKMAAPQLHGLANTWSSCVEQPIQCIFLALCASQGLTIYGGGVTDAYAHSPSPEVHTYLSIDDAYADWYQKKSNKILNHRLVLSIQHSLQGHPESGKIWMIIIDRILIEDIGVSTTTHDRCIYTKQIDGKTILMLGQVDNLMIGCTNERIARNIYHIIGTKIRFKTEEEEDSVPFEWLGIVKDYNGVDS
jgi:hypothetical protein